MKISSGGGGRLSSGSGSGSSNSSAFVEPKLLHLVRKVVSDLPLDSPLELVVETLRERHREYQRKDSNTLKRSVEVALEKVVQGEQRQQQRGGAGGGVSRKRRLSDKEEAQYDFEAQQHDQLLMQQQQLTGGGGGLNASLRNRYRIVQQERDQKEREQQAAAAAAEAAAAAKKEQEEKEKLLSNGDSTHSPPTTTGATSTAEASTPSKANNSGNSGKTPKRLKKKKTSRQNSSAFSDLAAADDNNNNSDLITTPIPRPKERYSDLGGLSSIVQQIRELIEYPVCRPELYKHLGVDPPRGVLLRGPPGCGKTHLANAIAGQLNLPYYRVSAPELVSSMSGQSEGRIRDLFSTAAATAPCLIFMDEIDAIAPKRGAGGDGGGGRGMEKRMVAQLLTCMDALDPQYTQNGAPVMVLGATNRPDSLDPALRRAGRFDREILLGVPDEEAREGILRVMTRGMRLYNNNMDGAHDSNNNNNNNNSNTFDYKLLARKTPGFVGADVRSLTKEAAVIAINRIFRQVLTQNDNDANNNGGNSSESQDKNANGTPTCSGNDEATATTTTPSSLTFTPPEVGSVVPLTPEQLEPLFVTMEDFLQAIPLVQPSSKREGFATVPDVSWKDIGALHRIREELTLSVLEPIRHPEKFQQLGLPLPAGVLLYGPPGCGKTLLAKAIANESGANFISVKGPELLDKYVGESERAVRVVFERARSSSPCIVFFDELDSLCPKRGSDSGGGGGVSERVVNQLLTEMDGLDMRRSVFVIAATNRPELIDPAMMRPGRLDKLLYVPLPTSEDRVCILKALATKIKLAPDVDLEALGQSPRAEGYSGADCAALLREAGLAVLRDQVLSSSPTEEKQEKASATTSTCASSLPPALHITGQHFDYAFNHVMPSVSRKDQARYDRIRDRMARARSRGFTPNNNTNNNSEAEDKTEDVASEETGASNEMGAKDMIVDPPSHGSKK